MKLGDYVLLVVFGGGFDVGQFGHSVVGSRMLIDTHAHLDFPDFSPDLDAVLARADEAGVTRILTIGNHHRGQPPGRGARGKISPGLCRRRCPSQCGDRGGGQLHGRVADAGTKPAGRRPWGGRARLSPAAQQAPAWLEGCDPFPRRRSAIRRNPTPRSGMARSNPPSAPSSRSNWISPSNSASNVVIHERDAWDDTLEILRPYSGKLRAVFHCFGRTPSHAGQLLELGHMVSFTGIVTFKNAVEAQETARQIPAESFMVETDCPFLAPVPFRGKRCEPAHTRQVAEHVARLRGEVLEILATRTSANAAAFFRFPD